MRQLICRFVTGGQGDEM